MLVIDSMDYSLCFTTGCKWEIFILEKSNLHIHFHTHRCFFLLHLVPIRDNGDGEYDASEVVALDPHPPTLATTDYGWPCLGWSTGLFPSIVPENSPLAEKGELTVKNCECESSVFHKAMKMQTFHAEILYQYVYEYSFHFVIIVNLILLHYSVSCEKMYSFYHSISQKFGKKSYFDPYFSWILA